jgi:hypothetical protein
MRAKRWRYSVSSECGRGGEVLEILSAGLSIVELRGKARRLKATQHDIQLIIIDYLQLLRGSSRRSQENRQPEITENFSGNRGFQRAVLVAPNYRMAVERSVG